VHDAQLLVHIRGIHSDSKGRYGVPRIHAMLRDFGIRVSRKRVARLCQIASVQGVWAKPRHKSKPSPVGKVANILDRNFAPDGPGQVLTGDVTYLWAGNRWVYLAVVLDLFNREVLSWALSANVDEELCLKALQGAVSNPDISKGFLMHTDQGSTYTAGRHLALIQKAGGVPSMSRRANCWDNSPTESFFKTLKTEIGCSTWPNMHSLSMDLFSWSFDGNEIFSKVFSV